MPGVLAHPVTSHHHLRPAAATEPLKGSQGAPRRHPATRGHMSTQLDFAFWDALNFAEAGHTPTDIFEQHIALAQQVEALGWNSYFVIEHQNTKTGVSAPSVYLTAVARATSTLRIGAMMWQLPFYHPLRLAQEVAMLDHLSHGRVEFGTGFGVHEH